MYGDEAGANPSVPEAQKLLLGLLAELPDEAVKLRDKVDRDLGRIQEKVETEIEDIRTQAEQRIAEVQSGADKRRTAILQHTVEQLEPLQKELLRAGELGKALGTFVLIQMLKARVLDVQPDPGNLLRFQQIGKSFCFQITGSNEGPVWGTDVYTSDSFLPAAAVHAGALDIGEDGVVRVTMVDMTGQPIRGSMRNGIMSMDWGVYNVGYRVARV